MLSVMRNKDLDWAVSRIYDDDEDDQSLPECGGMNEAINVSDTPITTVMLPILQAPADNNDTLTITSIIYRNPRLRYSYFRFRKTDGRYIGFFGILLPVSILTIFSLSACHSASELIQTTVQLWRHIEFSRGRP